MPTESPPGRWPFRKWFLRGLSIAGTVTTVTGPIAVDGGCSGTRACSGDAGTLDVASRAQPATQEVELPRFLGHLT